MDTRYGWAEIGIVPCDSGFGGWQRAAGKSETWEVYADLLAEIEHNADCKLYHLGKDELPPGLGDIRGLIHDEPEIILGWIDEAGIARYVGIIRCPLGCISA